MPYKHANGCTCMTLPEFLAAEGAREGKTGGEVLTDIMEDMADDDRKQEQYWKDNPDSLFKEFKEEAKLIADNDDPSLPTPTSLVKIVKVECHTGFRSSKISSTIWVRCKDRKVREVTWWRSDDSGSFYEPPDSDGDVAWGRVIPKRGAEMSWSDEKDTEEKLDRMLKETNEISAMKLLWQWIKQGDITFMEFIAISKLYHAKKGNTI